MISLKAEMEGFYKVTKTNKDGEITYDGDWFHNLITNNGLDLFGNSYQYITSCFVGSGSNTPAVTDTSLNSIIATTTSVQSKSYGVNGVSPYYVYVRFTYRFSAGSAAGNISEVGVGASSSNMFSRTLIVDSNGNPTTITVLSDEYLDVSYELRFYMPETDVTGSFNLNGTDYSYISRASYVNVGGTLALSSARWAFLYNTSSSGTSGISNVGLVSNQYWMTSTLDILDITSGLYPDSIPTASKSNNGTFSSYVNGSYQRDLTIQWPLTSGNMNIKSICGRIGLGIFQVGFTPEIPKTSSDIFTITLRISWGRR